MYLLLFGCKMIIWLYLTTHLTVFLGTENKNLKGAEIIVSSPNFLHGIAIFGKALRRYG